MNITKYEHACLVVEEQSKKLIIDPGTFTASLPNMRGVVAVVLTHVHADHFDVEKLRAIVQQNPNVRIFGTAEVAKEAGEWPVTAVTGGTAETVAPFSLAFYGEQHAEIHPTMPRPQNVGVLVNDTLYYPGDSFTVPGVPVKVLATPTSAPWLKAGEIIDFLRAVKPTQAFSTHDALLSDIGHGMLNNYVRNTCGEFGATFTYLRSGESLHI